MATFHLTDQSGAQYEIDAPDEHAAVAALGQVGKSAAAPSSEAAARPASVDRVQGILQKADDVVRAIANGITFGNADRFAAAASSATGIGGNSGDYAGNLERERSRTSEFHDEHPYVAGGSNLVGNVLGTIAGARVLRPILPAVAPTTLAGKTLLGIGVGGGLGTVQGIGDSKDWTNPVQTAKDAAVGGAGGAVVGGVIPGAGKLIGSGISTVTNALRGNAEGMSRGASRQLVSAVGADTPAAVQARIAELGDKAMLADAGPSLLGKAQGASLNSDEGRSVLQGALTTRNEGTNQRIMEDVNRALGPAEDPQTVTNAIRAHRSAVDNQSYPAALGNAPDVQTAHILTQLDDMIPRAVGAERRALENLRGMMMTTERRPLVDAQGHPQYDHLGNERFHEAPVSQNNAEVLHKVKQEIDNVIQYDQPGLGVPAGALTRQQGALKRMRGEVNDALETQVPGYRQANRQSAALAQRGEAVEAGTQYLGSGKTTPSPERFAAEFDPLPQGEKIAFAKGSRGNIERVLGTKANDLQALRGELQGEGGWNTAKIATVHGQQSADELIGSVERNLKFRDTHNKVVENSQTAQRQAAASAMKPTPASETPLVNPNMSVTGLAGTVAKKAVVGVINAILRSDPTKSYGEVARILSAQGPERDRHLANIVDAITRQKGHAVKAQDYGNRAAVISAILANGYAHSGPSRRQEAR